MKFLFKYADKISGAFILVSLFLFFGAIILILINQKVFIKKVYFNTRFEDSRGLKKNTEINFNGFIIGKVEDYRLNDKDTVDVDFFIYETYINRFTINSVLNKSVSPLSGSTVEFLKNDTTHELYQEFSFVPSLDTKEGKLIMASGAVKKKADAISNIISQVDELLSTLNSDNNQNNTAIGRILLNTADTMGLLKNTVDKVNQEMITFGQILSNFEALSYDMKDADGLAQRLVDPTGEYMFNSLQLTLKDLSKITDDLQSFTGFLTGQTKQIETVLMESKIAMQQAQDVMEGIKNNPLIKGGIPVQKGQTVINQNLREWVVE